MSEARSDARPLLGITLVEAGDDGRWLGEYVAAPALSIVAVRERYVEDDVRSAVRERGFERAAVAIDQRFMGFLAKRALDTLTELAIELPCLIHHTACIADGVTLGVGVRVAQGAIVASGAVLGDHARVLERAVVGCNASVGAYSTLDAGVLLGEASSVGRHSWLRAGLVAEPRSAIGDVCELGPAGVVRGVIPEGTLHVPGLDGPARIHRFG